MRVDSIRFAHSNQAANRKPRCVIRIEFDVASIHLTSHDDITGVAGDVIYGVVQSPSAISQRIFPDEGRSTIGAFSFSIVDKAEAFTIAIRSQLFDQLAGLRRRKVQFYVGYEGMAFSEFQLFQTQIVSACSYHRGVYDIKCQDITRELRQEVFRPNSTTLRDSVTDTALSIPVYDTSRLVMVAHGPAYSDAPNATVGYARIEDEVVRYSSKTPDTLFIDGPSGRGCLNTKAVAHAVDVGAAAERRTKVEEYIYLEGPGPQIALAVMTGELYGTANTLPDNWHLGIAPSYVRESDFTGIGLDLWDPSDDSAAQIFRWDGLKQQDGKKFLEKEIYLLLGCYSPVYSDGAVGLRRMAAIISDTSPVVTLTDRELIEVEELNHAYGLLHNNFRILWAWNAITEDYERITQDFDSTSQLIHGESPLLAYEFKGLHSQRATDSTISVRMDSIRDRYNEPPQTIGVTVFGSLDRLEVGDIVGLNVSANLLRDFAGEAGDYNRSFEIQNKSYDWSKGRVSLELFGSTARPDATPSTPSTSVNALPDAYYISEGTNFSSLIAVTSNVAATGSFTISGPTSLNASAAVVYWDNDLTIPSGCNITITGNVQFRIRGYLTFNGTINGVGGGHAGTVDDGGSPWYKDFAGTPGFIGHSRGYDGIRWNIFGRTQARTQTIPVSFTRSLFDAFPYLTLHVVGNTLVGLPDDMRGAGGAPGGRIVSTVGGSLTDLSAGSSTILSIGGAGTAGGAGLAIICRGMSFGVSALVNLSGTSPATPSLVSNLYPGAGGAGSPGGFLILLDGNYISIPVITGKFVGATGTITQPGVPLEQKQGQLLHTTAEHDDKLASLPFTDCGYDDPAVMGQGGFDMSNAAHRIQYIPIPEDAVVDADPRPPVPYQLAAGPGNGGNILTWYNPDLSTFDVIEVWASLDNNRTNALKVGETRSSDFTHRLPLGGLFYYWIRSKINPISGRPAVYSEWERVSSTDGESSNIETPGEVPETPDDFTATGKVNGIQFNWRLPWAKLSGIIRLYEAAHSDPFPEGDPPLWEGYDFGVFITKADTTVRDYWLVLAKGGAESTPEPNGAGIPAAASSTTSVLTASAYPQSVARSATIGTNPRTVISPPTTCTASGGTGPYTYAWTFYAGGTGITTDTPTFDDTTFSGSHNLDGTVMWGTARCTVTDSLSATAFADVEVQLTWPSTA
jgi:hypothetical protein